MDEANAIRFFNSIKEQVSILPSVVPLESACPFIGREVLQAAKSSTIETVSLRWIVPTFLECLQRYLWGGRLDPVERLHRHGPVRLDDIAADIDHLMYLFEMKHMSVDDHFQVLRTNGSNFPRQPQSSSNSTVAPAPGQSSLSTHATASTLSTQNPSGHIASATPPLAMEANNPASLQQTPFGSTTSQGGVILSPRSSQSRFDAIWEEICSGVRNKDFLSDNLAGWKEASRPFFARYEQSEFEDSEYSLQKLDKAIMAKLYSANTFDISHWCAAHRVILKLHWRLRNKAEDQARDRVVVENWHERFMASLEEMEERFSE